MNHRNVVCLYLFLLLLILAGSAATVAATLSGEVVNEETQAVANAEVWVIRLAHDPYELKIVGSGKTDAQGAFVVPDVEFGPDAKDYALTVAAYREGLALGWQTVDKVATGLEIICETPTPTEGSVVTPAGEGIAAQIEPSMLHRPDALDRGGRPLYFPDELKQRFAVKTEPNGRFTIGWRPANARLSTTIAAPGYGEVKSYGTDDDSLDLTLSPAGLIRGRVICEAEPKAVAGLEVLGDAYHRERGLRWGGKAETDNQGRFEIGELQPGPLEVRIKFAAGAEWQAPGQQVEVNSGETTEVEFKLARAHLLKGRVVDAQTGEPIEGVGIYISQTPAGRIANPAPTDQDGYYTLCSLPGRAVVYVARCPEPYMYGPRGGERREVLVANADVTIPDISLKKGVTVEGVVLDDQGQPVAGATIFHTGTEFGFHLPTYADQEGKFSIPQIDPDRPFTIRTRDGDRMTEEPLSVDPRQTEPLRVTIREGTGARLCVRALDDAGKPMAGAEVVAMWRAENWGRQAAKGKTDATGCFESELVWPEGTYQMTVTAEDCPKAKTDSWTAVSGQTHDFGDVVLVAARGFVEGRVVDAEGQPVVGAKVYNNGDGPQALAANSDEQGHFRLEGLYKGHAYVFAEKGDLFGGTRMPAGAEDGVITVTPEPVEAELGEPAQAVSLTSPETDKRVAEELILEALDKPGTMSASSYVSTLIATLAACDPDKAFQLSAERGGKDDDRIMRALGNYLLCESPQDALGLLESIEGARSRLYALLNAAEKLTPSDPEGAREVLETIIPVAHAVGAPKYQAAFLASCGEALYRLDPQAAVPVIRKAESIAQMLPNAEWDAYARGRAAEALCHIDLDGALALIKDLTGEEHETTRHQPNIAARIAATQPEQAAELMRVLSDWSYARHMPRVVYNMAATYPDKALELAETVKEPAAKARSLGFIALALAEISPNRAAEVFGEALATVRGIKGDPRDLGYQSREAANTMAELAQLALQIGYPGVERIAWRAISRRPAPSQSPWDGYEQRGGEYIKNLAFAHPALTRDLIQDTMARQAVEEQRGHSDLVDNLTIAAALVDANLAAKLVRALPEHGPEDEHRWTLRQYCHAASYLLRSPEERYTEAMGSYGQWVPGAPHTD